MRNSLTVFTNWLDRLNRVQQGCSTISSTLLRLQLHLPSRRVGRNIRAISTSPLSERHIGARTEYEEASNRESWLAPVILDVQRFTASQRTNSAFVLHQLPTR